MRELFLFCFLWIALRTIAQPDFFVGSWTTIDDKTNQPISVVRIYKSENGKYFGQIEQILVKGHENDKCEKCREELKGKPIVGLVIVRNMELVDGELHNGSVMDPNNGNTYYGKIKIDTTKNQLILRGSLDKRGIFGRSQIWKRNKE